VEFWRGVATRRLAFVVVAFGAVLVLSACSGKTTGATNVTDGSATLTSQASCASGETCRWYWEYWPANQPRSASAKTPVQGPVSGPAGPVDLSVKLKGLRSNTDYRWVFCGSGNNGASYLCVGPNGRAGSTTVDPPPDYDTFTTAPVRALAERWDGTSWTIQSSPRTSGATPNELFGVSCASGSACTAVGDYGDTSGLNSDFLLAEHWNGATWSVESIPGDQGAVQEQLQGVSCPTTAACVAVGTFERPDNSYPVAAHWDGMAWTPDLSASAGGFARLPGVSCTSATDCMAVGGGYLTAYRDPFAEHWNGTSWTQIAVPKPDNATSDLAGISCTSATACTAVGRSDGAPLAEQWDGTSWTAQSPPSPTASGGLAGVSCKSATACVAVGSYTDNANTQRPLVERWDGSSWTIQTTPSVPHSALGAKLLGVACTSASACEAVGERTVANGSTHTLAEAWNGTTWSIQPTPPPIGKFAVLNGVSCTSATGCTAVGSR
jgi:hypothetical protein